jgi:hypothetical protein
MGEPSGVQFQNGLLRNEARMANDEPARQEN